MKLGELPFGSNIKIPERREDGTYELAGYTLGCLNNFDVGTAGLIRKNIHSRCEFGKTTEYADSVLDERMNEIYGSFPAELCSAIIPVTLDLAVKGGKREKISRSVFALTGSMAGLNYPFIENEGLTWPIFNTYKSRVKTYNGSAANWWLASRYGSSYVWRVITDGSSYDDYPSNTYGVAPAFVIPSSMQIEDTPDEDGSYRLTELQNYHS